MKEEGKPLELPALSKGVKGKVILWGEGIGWAHGERDEAESGPETTPGGLGRDWTESCSGYGEARNLSPVQKD